MNFGKLIRCIRVEVLFLLGISGMLLFQSVPLMFVAIKPAVSFEDMLDGTEVKEGSRIEGNVVYSLDYFATESTYTKRSDGSRSGSRKSGKYYLIPTANGFIGLKCRQADVALMDKITDETYEIWTSSDPEAKTTTEYFVQGRVEKMDENIAKLYREYLEEQGFTSEQIEALGTPLLIQYTSFGAVAVFFAIGILLILIAVLIVWLRYRKQGTGSGLRRAEDLPDNPPV